MLIITFGGEMKNSIFNKNVSVSNMFGKPYLIIPQHFQITFAIEYVVKQQN